MDYQLIIFLSKKEIMAVDIAEDGECEEVSIDGNASMSYSSVEDFADFKQYICDAYNVDEIEEMEAGATIVNCGADAETSISLLEELKDFKGVDSIDVTKLLPIVAQNKGLLKKNEKVIFSVMGNCFAVKCDAEGVAKVSKVKVTDRAMGLTGEDFGFLYFFKGESSGISEEEAEEYRKQIENVRLMAENKMTIMAKESEENIQKLKNELNSIIKERDEYKKIVGDKKKEQNAFKEQFVNAGIGDVVKFGRYYINSENKKEDIEWIVLRKDEKNMLLLSKYCLDVAPRGFVTETNDTIQEWLNNTFYQTAFNNSETKYIRPSKAGNKLFLISEDTLRASLPNVKKRACYPTRYAKSLLEEENLNEGKCDWWLNDFYTDGFACYVQAFIWGFGGDEDITNSSGYNSMKGIRPTFWFDMKALE